ncbi:MAG: hypothetical protein IPI30_21680 [Saprospiraceae bacterium]|nr:hypothetical protein [Candidatus Vicinibacter affinis]
MLGRLIVKMLVACTKCKVEMFRRHIGSAFDVIEHPVEFGFRRFAYQKTLVSIWMNPSGSCRMDSTVGKMTLGSFMYLLSKMSKATCLSPIDSIAFEPAAWNWD